MYSPSLATTHPCQHANFVGWHLGRPHYTVWLIMADTPPIRDAVHTARQALDDYLLPAYHRQPHITLGVRGFPQRYHQDRHSYTAAMFEHDIAILRGMQTVPFEIKLGAVASFNTAPYLTLTAGQETVHALHRELTKPGGDVEPFIPHITLGFYRRAIPLYRIESQASQLALPECQLAITHIELAAYDSTDTAGRLQTICRFNLATQHLETIRPHLLCWTTEQGA